MSRDPRDAQEEATRILTEIIEVALAKGARLEEIEEELKKAGVTLEKANLLDAVKKFRHVVLPA